MRDLPQGYEPHEIPADYVGKLFIEGQMRAFAVRQPLTDEEIVNLGVECEVIPETYSCEAHIEFARAIEQAHGIGSEE